MSQDQINLQYTTIKDPLPDFIYEGLASFSRNANAYKPQPLELIEKLANKYRVPKEMIYLTAGIDEAIQMFAQAYGQNTFVFTPTYIVYAIVEELGGRITSIPSIKNSLYTISTNAIKDASLIFLANPNNPSGITSKEEVLTLVQNNPQAKVVIDEAYGEFANLSVLDRVEQHPHMAVLRSFSKDYSMAGNRLGYIVAHPSVIQTIKNKTQWANVSYLSVGAALIALDHEEYFAKIRQDINSRRDEFMAYLEKAGFSVIPSQINAILFHFPSKEAGTKFAHYLTSHHFVISHANGNSNLGLDESYVRVAVGTREQMEALKEIIGLY